MSEPYFFEIISGTGVIGIMSMIRYFLKKQNDKIESIDEKLRAISKDFSKEMKLTKKEVVALFHDICHERQSSCSSLMEVRIEGVQKQQTILCSNIEEVRSQNKEAWREQGLLNDTVKNHLARQNGIGGKAHA